MNLHENTNIMSNIERFKRLMIGEGPMMAGHIATTSSHSRSRSRSSSSNSSKIQLQKTNNFDCQSQMLPHGNLMDWYAYQSLEATAKFLALDDDNYFVSNRMHYSKLPQTSNGGSNQVYNNWTKYKDYGRANQQEHNETEMWQLLGKNVCQWIKQPNGQPLVSPRSLAKMSGVEIACVLMAAHLLKHRQDPKENCMLTYYNCNELRSYVVKSDEVQDVLNRCKQRECRTSFFNAIPHRDAPMPRMLPRPPARWLHPRQQTMPEETQFTREFKQHLMLQPPPNQQAHQGQHQELQLEAEAEVELHQMTKPKSRLKPWQYHPRRHSRQKSHPNGNGGRRRINPNHVLTEVWHPSIASCNYKLYNH